MKFLGFMACKTVEAKMPTVAEMQVTNRPVGIDRPIQIEDWLKNHIEPRVSFGLPYSPSKADVITCYLRCSHKGNDVSTDYVVGRSVEDALQNAVAEIEKTIGTGWRSSLSPAPQHQMS